MNADDLDLDLDEDGLPEGRSCPVCGAPLTPEHLDGGTLALAWTCAEHGLIELTPDPLGEA